MSICLSYLGGWGIVVMCLEAEGLKKNIFGSLGHLVKFCLKEA